MVSSFLWLSLILMDVESNIEWFKQTPTHQQNIQLLTTGWHDCTDWDPSNTFTRTQQIEIETLFGRTVINIPPILNAEIYNFTSNCITIQVPLNWDDQSSANLIDYHLARIFPLNPPSSTNGAFWMV